MFEMAKSISLYLHPNGIDPIARAVVSSGILLSCIFEKIIPAADIYFLRRSMNSN